MICDGAAARSDTIRARENHHIQDSSEKHRAWKAWGWDRRIWASHEAGVSVPELLSNVDAASLRASMGGQQG